MEGVGGGECEGRGDSKCNVWKLIVGEFKRTRGVCGVGRGSGRGRVDSRCNFWKLIVGEFKRTRGCVCGGGDSKCNVWKLLASLRGRGVCVEGGGGVGGEGGLKVQLLQVDCRRVQEDGGRGRRRRGGGGERSRGVHAKRPLSLASVAACFSPLFEDRKQACSEKCQLF